jgi:hypothetical protein
VKKSFPQIKNESHGNATPYDRAPRRNHSVFKSLETG